MSVVCIPNRNSLCLWNVTGNDVIQCEISLSSLSHLLFLGTHHSNVLSVMWFNLKVLPSQFFFFCIPWRTDNAEALLIFPRWGSDAYYSILICPEMTASLEAVTDCPNSEIIHSLSGNGTNNLPTMWKKTFMIQMDYKTQTKQICRLHRMAFQPLCDSVICNNVTKQRLHHFK